MNEVLADVSALTGEPKYLALARRFAHQSVLAPLAEGRDTLDGLHSNTQIPKFIGYQRVYELDGDAALSARPREFFWQTVVERRSFATGGNGDGEHFFPSPSSRKRLGSAKTMETCCTHNMLRLTRALFTREPRRRTPITTSARSTTASSRRRIPTRRHDDVFPGDAAGLRAALSHARRVVLVLHGHRHGEPREVRRLDLLPRRATRCT